jgi:Tfp pilus assembly PilM family ATPase/Tfp pilus assembly protein PilN
MNLKLNTLKFRESYLGLDISSRFVKVVELEKNRKGMVLKKWGSEPVPQQENRDALAETIQRLKQRMGLNGSRVITRMDGFGVRHTMVKTPVLSFIDTEQWLQENIHHYLPPGVQQNEVTFSFYICAENGEQQNVLLVIAKNSEIIQRIDLLQNLGLKVESLGAGYSDVVNALLYYEDEFYQENVAIITINPEQTTIIICENGLVSCYQELLFELIFENISAIHSSEGLLAGNTEHLETDRQTDLNTITQQWYLEVKQVLIDYWVKSLNKQPISKIYFCGKSKWFLVVSKYLETIAETEIAQPLKGILSNGKKLAAEYALPAGLALKGHYPLLNSINLLPAENKEKIALDKEKNRALRIILAAGIIFLLLVIFGNVSGLYVNNKLETSQENFQQLQSRIIALEKLESENLSLSQQIGLAKEILVNRSNYSLLLWEISRILPKKVWLREISVSKQSPDEKKMKAKFANTNSTNFSLSGFTFTEQNIALVLKALENSKMFIDLKLIRTRLILAKQVYEKTKLKRVSLIRFTIDGAVCERGN